MLTYRQLFCLTNKKTYVKNLSISVYRFLLVTPTLMFWLKKKKRTLLLLLFVSIHDLVCCLCFSLALIAFLLLPSHSLFGIAQDASYGCDVRSYTASGTSCEGKRRRGYGQICLTVISSNEFVTSLPKYSLKHEM